MQIKYLSLLYCYRLACFDRYNSIFGQNKVHFILKIASFRPIFFIHWHCMYVLKLQFYLKLVISSSGALTNQTVIFNLYIFTKRC
jgi:hypothetical protein